MYFCCVLLPECYLERINAEKADIAKHPEGLILFLFILFSLNAVVLVNIVCFKQKIIIALKHLIFILEKSVYFLYHYFKKNLHLIYKLDYIILVCFYCFISKNIIYNA